MRSLNRDVALLPLRLIIGFGFAAHGWAKLIRGPDNFAQILETIGVPQPGVMAWAISLFELIGGASVMAGAFVSVLSIPLTITMMTAAIAVHLQYGFSSIRLKALTPSGAEFGPIGYELNLLYIAGLIALGLSAPTKPSLDFWLKARRQKRPGGHSVNG